MAVRNNLNKQKKVPCFLLLLILFLTYFSFQTMAEVQIDTDVNVSVSFQYAGKKGPVTGASFHVYHVADVAENGSYIIKDAFKDIPIAFDDLTQNGWQQLATTLKGYVWKEQIAKLDSGATDKEGMLKFPSDGVSMKPGLYLILGDTRMIGDYTYYATPFLIRLPDYNTEDGKLKYDVNVVPKYHWKYDSADLSENGITRKVLKVWKDAEGESVRPEAITVQLLRDGQPHKKVMLHEGNNWRYTWYDLHPGYDWMVVEENVPGYTVNIRQEGITFVITNTYTPETPTEPSDDGISSEYNDEEGRLGVLGDWNEDFFMQTLPQTGQLWWPVPVLVCLGLVCMMIGAVCRRNAYEEE